MAVPSVMNDLSTTANDNSPAGSESPVSTDDFHRAIQAILRTTNAKGNDIASATTTDIGAATGEFVDVTGTTTITGLGTIGAGIVRTVRFTGALTLTHNATSLILPGGVNKKTQANDIAMFRSLGAGNWICVGYTSGLLNLAAGADIASASTVDLTAATGNCPKITGTTAVTAWTMNTGQQMKCIADGALPLTYDATTNNIEGGADYTCAAGDIINLVKGLDGVVRVRIETQSGVSIKGGKVLKVVQGKTTTVVTNSTDSFVDTGLSASITPSRASSKILVLVNQTVTSPRSAQTSGYGIRVLRNSTVIQAANGNDTNGLLTATGATGVNFGGVWSASVLDSPATTSEITYSVTAKPYSTADSGSISHQSNNAVSSIILMEIAA